MRERMRKRRERSERLRQEAHGKAVFGQGGDPLSGAELVLALTLPTVLGTPFESMPDT